jgi:hypothetical protein
MKHFATLSVSDLQQQRLRLPDSVPPLEEVLRSAGSWARILRESDTIAQREVLASLVELVTPVRVRFGIYAAELAWTPLGEALRQAVRSVPRAAA